jgi:hypothetical protein
MIVEFLNIAMPKGKLPQEAEIEISAQRLTEGQSMTVRVALQIWVMTRPAVSWCGTTWRGSPR